MWEVGAWIMFGLVGSLVYVPLMVEQITRAVVRGWMDERFNVNRRLYGQLTEKDDDGKQE